jgi:hypothetical protein
MRSLDFLTPRDVTDECIRFALLPGIAVAVVGCIAWALHAVFGSGGPEEPRAALLFPLALSAIYGNVAIYNVRYRHGIKVFGGRWWLVASGLAMVWTVGLVVLATLLELLLSKIGVLPEARSAYDALQGILAAVGFSAFFSLLPAKGNLVP